MFLIANTFAICFNKDYLLTYLLMCVVKLGVKLSYIELRQRLGIEDIVNVVQRNRLRWCGHVLRKDDDDEKGVTLEVEGAGQRDRPMKTWKEVVDTDANDLHLKWSDAVDRNTRRVIIGRKLE